MRGEFEKLAEIAPLIEFVSFSSVLNRYSDKHGVGEKGLFWLNGAWFAYQEQQKRIDIIIDCVKNNTADYDLDNKIQELLK